MKILNRPQKSRNFQKKNRKTAAKKSAHFFPFFQKKSKISLQNSNFIAFFCKIFYFLSIAGNVQLDFEYSIVDRNHNQLLKMPQTSKSDAVLRLEAKQSKLKKIEKSLRKQLAKQRHDDKVAKQKAKRDLVNAQEKQKERDALKEFSMLTTVPAMYRNAGPSVPAPKDGNKTADELARTKTHDTAENARAGPPRGKESMKTIDSDEELEETAFEIDEIKAKSLDGILDQAEEELNEVEGLLSDSSKNTD